MSRDPQGELTRVYEEVVRRNPGEGEFHQTVRHMLDSLGPVLAEHPELAEDKLIERICEPERQIIFRVPWVDDKGQVHIQRGYRVELNSALGPYKGGLRFHRSVNLSIMKFLAFEQVFKNALTGMPLGGAKGGADFAPEGRSRGEVMRFCQSFMTELHRHLGERTDVPGGDIGVRAREIGYLFGQYKRITNRYASGVLTGKSLELDGSLVRPEATGYGVAFFTQEMLQARGDSIDGKICIVSGAGNVALHAIEKLQELGGQVIACSDSSGYVRDRRGLDLSLLKRLKQEEGRPLRDYMGSRPHAEYVEGGNIWSVPCQVAIPAARENELDGEHVAKLLHNGCLALVEGANMPTTPRGVRLLLDSGIAYGPAKAANAGGVATSGLEMQQNASLATWSFEHTERRLRDVMVRIHALCTDTAERYGTPGNYVNGANIAGFLRVARATLALGLI